MEIRSGRVLNLRPAMLRNKRSTRINWQYGGKPDALLWNGDTQQEKLIIWIASGLGLLLVFFIQAISISPFGSILLLS
jgi:hypothetical protein